MSTLSKDDKQQILSSIRSIEDYPKKGIVFKDITTLLNNEVAFELLMKHLSEYYGSKPIDFIAGIESRGFIFGSALATRLKLPFVPIRKPGKLPHKTLSEKYELEYGSDEVHIHIDAFDGKERKNVLLIDDLIATGGTAQAAASLINKVGATCFEACFILNIVSLKGVDGVKKITDVYSVIDLH